MQNMRLLIVIKHVVGTGAVRGARREAHSNRNGPLQPPLVLGPSVRPGGRANRTAMGHRRRRGAWGCPQGLGGGPPELQQATAASVGPRAVYRESQ